MIKKDFIEFLIQIADPYLDCSNLKNLKSLKFEIGGKIFEIEPEFFVLKVSNQVFEEEMGFFNKGFLNSKLKSLPYKCVPGFMPLNPFAAKGKFTFLLGTPFMKKFYTIFDREKRSIGLALAKH